MIKRVFGIAAVAALVLASFAFCALPLSAQSFQMDGGSYNFAFLRGALEYVNGTQECRIYSEAAQSQASANLRLRCGYTGARWDKNPNIHFWWCRVLNRRASLLAELRNREMDLQRCLDRFEFGEFPQAIVMKQADNDQLRERLQAWVNTRDSSPAASESANRRSTPAASASRIYYSVP